MIEREQLGMQHQSPAFVAVETIADDRRTEAKRMRGVHAQLMRPAATREERHASVQPSGATDRQRGRAFVPSPRLWSAPFR